MADRLTGGCACGAVRYEVTGKPGISVLCQCRRCQRATGTGHAPGFQIDRSQLTISGELSSHESPTDSGHVATHRFCPTCGSPVMCSTTRFANSCSIYAGSLDDPSLFHPEQVIFGNAAQPWDFVDPKLPK